MALFLSQTLSYVASRGDDKSSATQHHDTDRAVPLIKSPVDPKAYAWLRRRRRTNKDPAVGQIKRTLTVAQFEAEHSDSGLAGRIFRKQHSASTLELFYDLFFVANLAVFTDNHAKVDAESVANYIGFFSILWCTWFHVSIYDVRFYTDCLAARFFKMVQFGVMASFVGLGPVYNTIEEDGSSRSFQGLAIVMMAMRFVLCIQYASVLWFVHGFEKTLVPLLLTMTIYLLSGFAFLGTYLSDAGVLLGGAEGSRHVQRWYIIIGIEALAVIVVSSIWRVLSFKHTHLVERVGLLTLIIMGEGIIGLTKSVAYVLEGTNISVWGEIGLVSSAVILIYFIYLLYFDNVEHHRFGSIRQQIWVLLHFALHVAILMVVEGSTGLIIWDAVRSAIQWFEARFPSTEDPSFGFTSADAFLSAINKTIADTTNRYHYAPLTDYYDPASDLQELGELNSTFGSKEWTDSATEILTSMKYNIEYFLFQNFNAEGPEAALEETKDPEEKVHILNDSFRVVFEYFFITAGALLIMLGIMVWFGKTNKRSHEHASVVLRFVVGAALACVSAVAFVEVDGQTSDFRFNNEGWIIPIVTFSYLAVLSGDNWIKLLFRTKEHRRRSMDSTLTDDTSYNVFSMSKVRSRNEDRRRSSGDSGRVLVADAARPAGTSRGYSHVSQDEHDEHQTSGGDVGNTTSHSRHDSRDEDGEVEEPLHYDARQGRGEV